MPWRQEGPLLSTAMVGRIRVNLDAVLNSQAWQGISTHTIHSAGIIYIQ